MSIVTLTFVFWPPNSIGSIISLWRTSPSSLVKKHTNLCSLSCSQACFHICVLWPWPLTSKINRHHLLTIANMSAKYDEKAHTPFVSIMFTSLKPYMYCDHWPLTSKINRIYPLTMTNMYGKFDEKAHKGLVSILFTSLFQYMSIVTLTFDLWPPKSIGFILSLKWTCLPSLMRRHTMV